MEKRYLSEIQLNIKNALNLKAIKGNQSKPKPTIGLARLSKNLTLSQALEINSKNCNEPVESYIDYECDNKLRFNEYHVYSYNNLTNANNALRIEHTNCLILDGPKLRTSGFLKKIGISPKNIFIVERDPAIIEQMRESKEYDSENIIVQELYNVRLTDSFSFLFLDLTSYKYYPVLSLLCNNMSNLNKTYYLMINTPKSRFKSQLFIANGYKRRYSNIGVKGDLQYLYMDKEVIKDFDDARCDFYAAIRVTFYNKAIAENTIVMKVGRQKKLCFEYNRQLLLAYLLLIHPIGTVIYIINPDYTYRRSYTENQENQNPENPEIKDGQYMSAISFLIEMPLELPLELPSFSNLEGQSQMDLHQYQSN